MSGCERAGRYPMKLSASQAAQAVGKSVPTITRAIKSGKLSAERLPQGGYAIDPAELHRVWPAVNRKDDTLGYILGRETHHETSVLEAEIEALRTKIADIEAERERERSQLSETVDDLRRRLDAESAERRALTAQITVHREKSTQRPKGILAWFWKGGR